MVNSAATRVDPAADAAYLLRRIGLAVLYIIMPMAALVSRRGTVIIMPIGAILLILAALIEPAEKPFGSRLTHLLRQPVIWLVLGFLLWAAASLGWAPFARTGTDRLANLAGLIAIFIGVLASIPARMRAPTLYVLPIGAFAAAAFASVVVLDVRLERFMFTMPGDGVIIQRGLATLVLMSIPAGGWLVSRGRILDAGLLLIALLAVAFAAKDMLMMLTIVAGALAFLAVRVRPVAGALALAIVAVLVLAVAAVPLFAKTWQGQTIAGIQLMPLLDGSFLLRLARAVTGYGLETAPRMPSGQYFLPAGPTYFAGLWFDLGLMAAGLVVGGMAAAFRLARSTSADVAAAALGLIAVVTVQGLAMPGTTQAWWLSSVIAAGVGVAAISRGQGRSRRPGIGLFARPEAAARA
ncbi:MAG: hypothetical protein ACRCTD_12495 [Beijerinckiaceae bacterium]